MQERPKTESETKQIPDKTRSRRHAGQLTIDGSSPMALWLRINSSFPFGLAQACDSVARFPLAPFLQQFETLKAFEDVAFATQVGGRAQTAML